ncbi:unnamed protein product [Boreogadus saida]
MQHLLLQMSFVLLTEDGKDGSSPIHSPATAGRGPAPARRRYKFNFVSLYQPGLWAEADTVQAECAPQ